jgi:hypothetical protein
MSNVEFNEESQGSYVPTATGTGLTGWLISNKIARNTTSAQQIQLGFAIICLLIAVYFFYF